MICTIVAIIIWLCIAGLLYWLATWFIAQLGLAEPFAKIVHVLVCLLAFLIVLNALLALVGSNFWPVRMALFC